MKKNNNIISAILKESEAYNSITFVDNSLQTSDDLGNLPIQPLYVTLKNLPAEKAAQYLPKLTQSQRTAMMDLDLWYRDGLDPENFQFWIRAYHSLNDEVIRKEFVTSAEFLLYLKGRFNIWTFDVDDPMYPDHDNYFLTDDNLLLIEFDENFELVSEVRTLVRNLYYELGVENAYSLLFKYVSAGHLDVMEEEYQYKKSRLADLGFVDYFDALKFISPYPSISVLNHSIKTKQKLTPETSYDAAIQSLHSTSLVAFRKKQGPFVDELANVSDEKRQSYLHFNFIRLLNGVMSTENALQNGVMAMTKCGERSLNYVTLGWNYLINFTGEEKLFAGENLFDRFDFVDLYKLGHSLEAIKQKELKRSLSTNLFDEQNEAFLGQFFNEIIDNSLDGGAKITDSQDKPRAIQSYDDYLKWTSQVDLVMSFLPYIQQFYTSYTKLRTDGLIQDSFYFNYDAADVDFEAILMSSYANFILGNYSGEKSNAKMGLTIDEYKSFASFVLDSEGEVDTDHLNKNCSLFQKMYGMEQVINFLNYLQMLLSEHVQGYSYDELEHDDFKHVGGPIILNPIKH